MKQYGLEIPRSQFIFNHEAWFDGIDESMERLGSVPTISSHDLIQAQNAAIRNSWLVTGKLIEHALPTGQGQSLPDSQDSRN